MNKTIRARDSIVIRRSLPATKRRIFEAWTNPALMSRWFFPEAGWSVKVSVDFRVGGSYSLEMADSDGNTHHQFGTYRVIEPDSRLVFTWSCLEIGVKESVVTVELRGAGDRTELVLTHELPPDPEVLQRHEQGWIGCLASLDRFLANG